MRAKEIARVRIVSVESTRFRVRTARLASIAPVYSVAPYFPT
jgi:hypothetical protein